MRDTFHTRLPLLLVLALSLLILCLAAACSESNPETDISSDDGSASYDGQQTDDETTSCNAQYEIAIAILNACDSGTWENENEDEATSTYSVHNTCTVSSYYDDSVSISVTICPGSTITVVYENDDHSSGTATYDIDAIVDGTSRTLYLEGTFDEDERIDTITKIVLDGVELTGFDAVTSQTSDDDSLIYDGREDLIPLITDDENAYLTDSEGNQVTTPGTYLVLYTVTATDGTAHSKDATVTVGDDGNVSEVVIYINGYQDCQYSFEYEVISGFVIYTTAGIEVTAPGDYVACQSILASDEDIVREVLVCTVTVNDEGSVSSMTGTSDDTGDNKYIYTFDSDSDEDTGTFTDLDGNLVTGEGTYIATLSLTGTTSHGVSESYCFTGFIVIDYDDGVMNLKVRYH